MAALRKGFSLCVSFVLDCKVRCRWRRDLWYTTCSFGESVQRGFWAHSFGNGLCNVIIEVHCFSLVVTDFIPRCPCSGEGHPSSPLLFHNFCRSFLILTSKSPLHSLGMLILANVGIRV